MSTLTKVEIGQVADFELDGAGTNPAWDRAVWQPLARVGQGLSRYATRAKILYSTTGIYFLTDAEDQKLTCTLMEDFADLFREDVIEVFLWTDVRHPLYFEYEISPLNYELPILVPNDAGSFCGWRPWHYTGSRRTRHASQVRGGPKQSQATVTGWTAEFFIPFDLLIGVGRSRPRRGDHWRANIYRIDYDVGVPSQWAWCPATAGNFHDHQNFGTILFR